MKKTIILTAVLMLLCTAAAQAEGGTGVTLNGERLEFDVCPQIINDRIMVPVRGIFESCGMTVDWDEAARTVTAQKDNLELKLTIGACQLYKNDAAVAFDTPAQIVDGRTLVPVRAVAEALDCTVQWDAEGETAHILTKEQSVTELAKKPDENGTVWEYYTFRNSKHYSYLGIRSTETGNGALYPVADNTFFQEESNTDNFRITEDSIYFLRLDSFRRDAGSSKEYCTTLERVDFKMADTPVPLEEIVLEYQKVLFDGDYLYYITNVGGTHNYDYISAYNYIQDRHSDGLGTPLTGNWNSVGKLQIEKSSDSEAVISYLEISYLIGSAVTTDEIKLTYDCHVAFDKKSFEFERIYQKKQAAE